MCTVGAACVGQCGAPAKRRGTALVCAHPLEPHPTPPLHPVQWAEIMTNMKPKTYFLRPDVAAQMGFAIAREVFEQVVLGKEDK